MYGDVTVMRRRAGQLREQAVEVRSGAQALVGQADGIPWTGRAAETMRARVRERAARMREAAAAHEDAAEALERHATEVDRLTEAIVAAERTAAAHPDPDAARPAPGHKDWLTHEERA